ncbi:MAG: FkbM family methyltransferase [Steroidobacteraceae bacterium]|nr:FkbM family methyltransferase [Steroidobacteraceae bacterium]
MFRRLPLNWRRNLRALRLEHLVRTGRFDSDEPEFDRLASWLGPGDVALDVGANFGSYTMKMSEIVGESGRVFAFEPVPQTFVMLIRSLSVRGCKNVTAINAACSNENGIVGMTVPDDSLTGEDLYQASISGVQRRSVNVFRARIDALPLPTERLRLVKVDAEGHDAEVIEGMIATLRRAMPVLITEHPKDHTCGSLQAIGYRLVRLPGSPNGVFLPPGIAQ